jgi:hypothetical protein
MKTIHKKLFLLLFFCLPASEAQCFAIRSQEAAMREAIQQNIGRIMVLAEMKEVAADSSCRALSIQELFPGFRGDFSRVRSTRAWPPTVLDINGVPVGVGGGSLARIPADYTCDQRGGASCWQEAYGENFTTQSADLESHAIRGYCHRQNPRHIAEVFAQGFDVPAEFILLWSREYIQYKWGGPVGVGRLQSAHPENDIVGLYELNLAAADLWRKIQNCAAGSAELARRFYFEGRFSCANGAELREEVGVFSANIRNYYRSSFFRESRPTFSSGHELASRMRRGELLVQDTIGEMPSFHPLFTQMSLEFLLEAVPADRSYSRVEFENDIASGRNGVDARTFTAVGKLFSILPRSVANPSGLWPSASRVARGFLEFKSMQIAANRRNLTQWSTSGLVGWATDLCRSSKAAQILLRQCG